MSTGNITLSNGVPSPSVVGPVTARPNYTLVIALMAVTFALSIFFTFRPQPQARAADVTQLPMNIGSWQCAGDIPTDANTMKQMLADSFLHRQYVNPAGQVVDLLLVYRSFGRREFAHRPELCFPAGGFVITKKARTTLPYAGEEREAIHLTADGSNVLRSDGGSGVPVHTISYFFASGRRTEADFMKQQVWMAFERLIPNQNGWTFVRLTSPRKTSDEDALRAQQEFMRDYSKAIEDVITTDRKAAATAGATTGRS